MTLSGAAVRTALAAVGALGGQMRSLDELAAGANDALRQAPRGLTPAGAASFLATMAQESAYFRTTTEYGSRLRYDPYRGRTFEMITWRENYSAFGRWCRARGLVADPDVFVKDPPALSDYRFAWVGGVWYFEATDLWGWANAGDHRRVSQAVNGGRGRAGTSFVPNHWPQRDAMYRAFRLAGDALLPTGGPSPVDTEEDDLTPEQDRMLREVYAQLVRGTGRDNDPRSWGWQGWAGGTGEHLTAVDMLRRSNVEVRQLRNQVATQQAALDRLLANSRAEG